MDLGAYQNIDILSVIMNSNGINVPRLRGLRLMKDERPFTEEEIDDAASFNAFYDCESLCRSRFKNDGCYEYSSRADRLIKKYIVQQDRKPVDVKWANAHGKKRKAFKFAIKKAYKRTRENLYTFNKYCGRDDILYIHARIGGGNWRYYGGEVKDQPWFIEKVDDPFDSTYCDIYARIEVQHEENT